MRKRLKIVSINPKLFVALLKVRNKKFSFEGLPDGSKFCKLFLDQYTESLNLIFEHPSFDECVEGEKIPLLYLTIKEEKNK